MKLFTIDEIVSSILEETEGLDEEITDGIILRRAVCQNEGKSSKYTGKTVVC